MLHLRFTRLIYASQSPTTWSPAGLHAAYTVSFPRTFSLVSLVPARLNSVINQLWTAIYYKQTEKCVVCGIDIMQKAITGIACRPSHVAF